MKHKLISYFLPVFLLLSGCEKVNVVERVGVSVDTNAYYTAYRKNPLDPWEQINFNNADFTLETLTFTVEELSDPYSVVFVCPSSKRDLPHEVFVYHATAAEMTLLDFKCRKSASEIKQRALYGTIGGVNVATLSNRQGELVHMSLSATTTTNALEAFAAEVPIGARDVIAVKGLQSQTDNIIEAANEFYIRREVVSALTEKSQKVDIGFGEDYGGFWAVFDQAKKSHVTITGKKDTDNISAKVGFLSRNKSLLTLAQSNQTEFDFVPVPLAEYTGLFDGFPGKNEFQPNEGHELSAIVASPSGQTERAVRKFFTQSDRLTHVISLPKEIDSAPTLSLINSDKFETINTTWSEYKDPDSGETQLYRWIFKGETAEMPTDVEREVEVSSLNWHVHVTPGWINRLARTSGKYSLVLPVKYPAFAQSGGKSVNVWSDDWSFKIGTPIDWELTAFTTSKTGNPGVMIDYMLNRNIVEDYSFTESFLRSTVSSSSP